MNEHKKPVIGEEQQELLNGVKLRLLDTSERKRFDQLMEEEHYLKSADLVGEQLRYVAEYNGQWVALIAWSAAAYRLKHREQWIGWSSHQRTHRLPLVANNSRFLILKDYHVPNLATRVMKLCLDRLANDWKNAYDHPVYVVESFVDSQLFSGTCYKAGGWTLLGQTKGFVRHQQDFYQAHERPKQLWVKELKPGARTLLRGRNTPEEFLTWERKQKRPAQCQQSAEEIRKMCDFFKDLTDWRNTQSDYSISSLVTVCLCALMCKVCLGQRDLAAFAKNLSPEQKEALRFPRWWTQRGQPHRSAGETTFFRLLSNLKSDQLEKALLQWQDHVLGKRDPTDDLVCFDGKELLNSQGMKIVSAYSVKDGRWLGSEAVSLGSNEIPAAQTLLGRMDIEGSLVVADAMHTQTLTAQIIVQEKGGDYLFNLKANQKAIQQNVQQVHQGLLHDFSPSRSNGSDSDL